MINETFIKDLNKHVTSSQVSTELPPGSPRRYDPIDGLSKHNARIHRESAYADKYKNLPYTFSSPTKSKTLTKKLCSNCDNEVIVHHNCVGVVCTLCGKYSSVKEI